LLEDRRHEPPARPLLRGERAGWTPWPEALATDPDAVEPEPLDPDAPALILFPAGTTSAPKGAVHSSRTLVADTRQLGEAWTLS